MSKQQEQQNQISDLFIIGGGINGCGIARDASGRGLSVTLVEMEDLASATSSSSTKLFHGGLRYLEYLEIRLGLFFYENLGSKRGGRKILPGTSSVNLAIDPVGSSLDDRFQKAYEYSDCWVNDARLVVLNARDAQKRGASILTRHKAVSAKRINGLWEIETQNQITDEKQQFKARMLVNAGGPWVKDAIENTTHIESKDNIRLVRGSHIVTKRLFEHDKSYIFQGEDGRIMFAIPYENDFTLIGTTDIDHTDAASKPECSEAETKYICNFASKYFKKPITIDQVVWSYSGVRPLYNDGSDSATAATRDYLLKVDKGSSDDEAPLLNIFGGKITTYRRLAESALEKITPFFKDTGQPWTADASLPGGDFPVDEVKKLTENLIEKYPYLSQQWAQRLIKSYGTEAQTILRDSSSEKDLGINFGGTLTEREVEWLMQNEFAQTTEDIIWRRSKLGLHMNTEELATFYKWMSDKSQK